MAKANVGIISLGEMGAAIAQLLRAEGFHVLSKLEGRSEATMSRAAAAGVRCDFSSDEAFIESCDYVMSIVPPSEALATAERIAKACTVNRMRSPLVYLELNAVSPSTAKSISKVFTSLDVRVIDGGIIGGPPCISESGWSCPSIVLSGPYKLAEAPSEGAILAKVLNTKVVGDEIGTASGLKCCFASLTKGYTALAIQAFSTASRLGVLEHLEKEISNSPGGANRLEASKRSLSSMPPKAGRWVEEMVQINQTFSEEGGWGNVKPSTDIFKQIAGVYEFVSRGTDLGKEHVTNRQRGKTAEDAVDVICQALSGKH
ncbi:hypothetical protein, variant [Verruconis gallopava]|uniref:Phosphogluconate dehydrogenase NAD-binding putative C-terminal domain-containing protein n=1 Tax=Verruconis gallopava TaxID=253628 RepID=A0A0D2AQG6_9PEZI|nr:uncharacterized protein PV09_00822 [Verruconis gallopava]XP_016218772.1 hypothetical protein, variant [Verruconis gallopava]KIW08902.1 hypothetical protein PV09_00822 [Verruconis gallopava]KIW08903.1 hypothetical protein, variant [Verruconis gallopava]